MLHTAMISGSKWGDTIYWAPLRMAIRAVAGSSTVPAPMVTSVPSYFFTIWEISWSALGTVKHSSTVVTPPATQASVILAACSTDSARITATIPTSLILFKTASLDIQYLQSPLRGLFFQFYTLTLSAASRKARCTPVCYLYLSLHSGACTMHYGRSRCC